MFARHTTRKNTGLILPGRPSKLRNPGAEALESRIAPAAALTVTKIATFAPGGDVNGDGNFDPGDTILYTVILTNSGDADLTGVTFSDILDPNLTQGANVNVSPLALNDTFSAVGNTLLEVGVTHGTSPAAIVSGSVLANDLDFLGDTFTLTKLGNTNLSGGTASGTSVNGGTVSLNANGSFTYLPAAGFSGTDTFTYTIADKGLDGIAGNADDLTSVGTVTVTVGQKVWYVDNSYAGANGPSDGRSTRPFTSLTPLSTGGSADSLDGAGDIIFIHTGTGAALTSTILLESGQTLQGQGNALTVAGFPLVSAGTAPILAPGTGTAVTLGSNNSLLGFTIGNSGRDILGNGFGTLTVNNVTLNGTGKALDLTNGTFAAGSAFNSVATTGTTGLGTQGHGILLSNVHGSVSLGSTTVAGTEMQGIYVLNSDADISFGNTSVGSPSVTTGVEAIRFETNSGGARSFGTLTLSASQAAGIGMSISDTGGTIFTSGAATISDVAGNALTATGGAAISFSSLSMSAIGGNGITLNAQNGAFTTGVGGTIGTVSGTDVSITGGTGAVTITETITNTAGGFIAIDNHDAGNVTFSGNLSSLTGASGISVINSNGPTFAFSGTTKTLTTNGNAGVTLTGNTGSTINFTGGGLAITTTSGIGFSATGGGTVTVQGSNNTISSTTGGALNVVSTTIGAAGMTFLSISSGTAASGPAKGINLDSTGTSGGLTVTGTGTTTGSGGTIQKSTHGVFAKDTINLSLSNMNIINNGLNQTVPGSSGTAGGDLITGNNLGAVANVTLFTTTNVSLTNVTVTGSSQMGINGNAVNGLTISNSRVTGNGNESFESGIVLQNASGAISITGTNVRDNRARELNIANGSGTMTLTASNSQFGHTNAGTGTAESQQGILLQLFGTSNTTINASTLTISNNEGVGFTANGFQINADNGSPIVNGSITNSVFDNNAAHVFVNAGGSSTVTFDTKNNATMTKAALQAINYTILGGSTSITANLSGTISGNTIVGGLPTANAHAIDINTGSTWAGQMHIKIDSNTIQQVSGGIIATLDGNDSAAAVTPRVDLRITNNNISSPVASAGEEAIKLNAAVTSTHSKLIVGWDVGGTGVQNTISGHWANGSSEATIFLRNRFTAAASIVLPGYAGGAADDAAVQSYLSGRNSIAAPGGIGVATLVTHNNTNPFTNGAVTTPLLFEPTVNDVVVTPPATEPPANDGGTPTVTPPTEDGGTPPIVQPPTVTTPVQPPSVIVDDGVLSQAELDSLVSAAMARWEATGLTDAQKALLHSVTFSVEDLSGWYLGQAAAGHVTLDANAAGNSWFIDATPFDDSEFSGTGIQLAATTIGGAGGRIDALTTIMHELGHQLGLDDQYQSLDGANLMYGFLHQGERRLPSEHQADGAQPHLAAGDLEFAIGPINIGNLPVGKNVQVQFTGTINNNITANSVSNQGTASSAQTGNVLTDDPNVAGTANPTVTAVDLPDVSVAVSPGAIAEDGSGTLVYTFTRTGPNDFARVVNFAATGTASALSDYTVASGGTFTFDTATGLGTITFAPNSATFTLTLNATDDTVVEADETAIFTVASGTGYDVGTPSAATGTINNDDTDVSVSVSPSSVSEDGAGNLVYTFTRAGLTSGTHTVNFSVTGSPTFTSADYSVLAAAGITFTPGTGLGTVTFAAGETTKTVTLDPTADTTVEADETATVSVLAGTGYNIGAQASASGTITNDDIDVTLSGSPASVSEDGAPNLVYTFTRTGFLTNALTVNFTVGGGATFGTDYAQTGAATFTATTGTVTFAAGSNTATITLNPTADTIVEADETTVLTLAAGTGYNVVTAGAVTGTITNDDTDVTLAVSPASVNEDGAGTLLYTFTRTGVTTGALTVNFTVGGTAAFGTDYTQSGAASFGATTGTVTFAAGSNTAQITLSPTDDTTVEADETALLTVTGGTGYSVASPSAATGTILNDDTDITVAVAPGTVSEDGAGNLVYTFTRTGVTTGALTVNFNVSGAAAFGTDYTQTGAATFGATNGTVTFAAGSSTATVTLDPTADSIVEANEAATLTIAAGTGYNIGAASSATGTINNDDADVSLAVSPAAVAEDGATNLVYTFTRTGFVDAPLTVNFSVGGTATFTGDYTALGAASFGATSGTVTFLAGSNTATVTIDPVSDTNGEVDETVALSLTNGSGYSIGAPSAATGTILNDDTAVSVAVSPNVLESGSTGLVYTFTRTGDTSTALTVNFAYDGTATVVSDYTQAGAATFASGLGTIVIPIGQASAAVTLTPQNDALVEGAETAVFTVQPGAGYGVGAGNVATGTIDDNDFAVIRFTNELETVTEGTLTKFVSVELLITADGSPGSGTLARPVSYNLAALATGTAGASDFTFSSPQTITYNAGQGTTTTNIAVGITDDRAVEGNETIDLRLNTLVDGTGGNVTFNGPIDDQLTIRDNDTATIGFVSSTSTTAEDGTPQVQVELAIVATGTGPEVIEHPVSLTVSATGGTATGTGTDYTFAGPQTITFAANSSAGVQTVALAFNNDTIVEGNETVIFTANSLSDGTNGQITQSGSAQHTLTISDNDTATLQFVSATGSANEEGGNYAFDVQLLITANGVPNTGTLGRALNFAFTELAGDTSTLNADYTVASYAGAFGVGAASGTATRTVTIDDDTRVEGSETARFGLQVTNDGTGGQVSIGAQSTHTLTISDNDTATVTLVSNGTTVNESAGSISVGFALVITANNVPNSGTLERAITIDLKDAGVGTAISGGSDYTFASPQTVTFASGEGSSVKNVTVGLVDDTRLEGNESMVFLADNFVDGTGGAASFNGTPTYTAILQDNETAVIQLAADTALVSESAGGLPVGVTLVITANGQANTGTLDRPLSVDLTDVLPRTATPGGVDYTFSSPQTITFAVGDSSSTKTAILSVVNDALSEGNETLTIQLGTLNDSTGQASLGARQSTGITIADDDIDLAVTTTELANVIVAGGGVDLTYTITISNVGLTTATGVVLAEDLTLPPGVSIVSITPTLGTFETTVVPDGNWTIASMAPGTSATLTIVLAVDASAPEGTDIIGTHAFIASSNENVINVANDVSAEASSIDRQVDLQVTKTDSVTTVSPGGTLSYAVNFANNGPSNATGVVVTEMLPAGTTFNAAASTGTWVEGPAGTFKLIVGDLAAGATGSATFAVTATNPAPAGLDNITNTAVISDDGTAGADIALGNNSATDTDALEAAPDLQVSVIDDPVVTKRGDIVRYIVSFVNVGNQDATNVFLTMTLPANTTFDLGQSSGSWTNLGGDVYRIDLGNVGVGATPEPVAFAVRVNAFLPGGYNMLSTVATLDDDHANGTDPVLANNTETENTPIYQGIYAVAPGVALPRKAGPPVVQVYDISSGLQTLTINAYEGTYRDSVRVAVGDINGDGYDDIITSTRTGNGRVRVFDGVTGERFEGPFAELAAFPEPGARGAFVASGDVTGDGHDDIIVGSGQGARGGGKIKVFDGVTGSLVSTSEPFGPRFRGGVRVAVGDVNGDPVADVIASQGYGGNDVLVTSGASTDQLLKLDIGGARYRGGVFVAAADLNGDGITDLITGRDRGTTVVETFNGANGQLMNSITPFAPKYRFGARVAAADVDLDGIVDIIVGAGGRGNSEVKVFSGLDNSLLHSFQAFPMFPTGSLFVAGTSPVPGTPKVMPA